ncbi:MAG: hypothetical protein JNL11_20245 [Bdellovibrionaceae bacterium]|nr:hypothetical protein [Pseudobdellovibrionaceae bacterium]
MLPKRTDDALENWDLFVLRHQQKANIRIHFISFLMFWLGPILALAIHPIYWVLFFLSGMVGVAGHYFCKDGTVDRKEATSSVEVVVFSSLMAILFVSQSYDQEIVRVKRKYQSYLVGNIPSYADQDMFKKLGPGVGLWK